MENLNKKELYNRELQYGYDFILDGNFMTNNFKEQEWAKPTIPLKIIKYEKKK